MKLFWALILSSAINLTGLVLVFTAVAAAALASFYLCQGKALWTFGLAVVAIAAALIGAAMLVLG